MMTIKTRIHLFAGVVSAGALALSAIFYVTTDNQELQRYLRLTSDVEDVIIGPPSPSFIRPLPNFTSLPPRGSYTI